MEQLLLGVLLLASGIALIILGRDNSRSIKARDITNSTIIQGDVNINPEKSRGLGLMELTGWIATVGSFVVSIIALFKS
jgi:hypothetical protein